MLGPNKYVAGGDRVTTKIPSEAATALDNVKSKTQNKTSTAFDDITSETQNEAVTDRNDATSKSKDDLFGVYEDSDGEDVTSKPQKTTKKQIEIGRMGRKKRELTDLYEGKP